MINVFDFWSGEDIGNDNQYKSRQVQKAKRINVDREKNNSRLLKQRATTPKLSSVPTGSPGIGQCVCIQKSIYLFWCQPLGFWQVVSFPLVLFRKIQRVVTPLVVNCHVSATKMYIKTLKSVHKLDSTDSVGY